MAKLSDLEPGIPTQWRILFVGPSGSGKSNQSAQWRGTAPKFMFDFDNRILSLTRIPNFEKLNLDYISPKAGMGWESIDPTLERMKQLAIKDQYPFKVTIVSSISKLIKMLTSDSLKYVVSKADKTEEQEGGAQKLGSLTIPGKRNYLYRAEALNQIFDSGLDYIPNDFIVEAHMVKARDKDGNIIEGKETILAPEKFAEYLPSTYNEVWYFYEVPAASSVTNKEFRVNFCTKPLARTAIPALKAARDIDVTDKCLYDEVLKVVGD